MGYFNHLLGKHFHLLGKQLEVCKQSTRLLESTEDKFLVQMSDRPTTEMLLKLMLTNADELIKIGGRQGCSNHALVELKIFIKSCCSFSINSSAYKTFSYNSENKQANKNNNKKPKNQPAIKQKNNREHDVVSRSLLDQNF